MDQVSKELKAQNLGIPLYEKGDKKASLLWVDDVLLISERYKSNNQKTDETIIQTQNHNIRTNKSQNKNAKSKITLQKWKYQHEMQTM